MKTKDKITVENGGDNWHTKYYIKINGEEIGNVVYNREGNYSGLVITILSKKLPYDNFMGYMPNDVRNWIKSRKDEIIEAYNCSYK